MRRLLMIIVLAALLTLALGLSVVGASAAGQPVGGCATGFELDSIDYIVTNLAPPGFADTIRSRDGNGDGYLCARVSPTFVYADNTVPLEQSPVKTPAH